MYFVKKAPILVASEVSSLLLRLSAMLLLVQGVVNFAYASEKIGISPARPRGECELVQSTVMVKGDLKVQAEDGVKETPFNVKVNLAQQEHLVFVEGDDWKSLHNYLTASGELEVGGQKMSPKMMANRGLIFAETQGDRVSLYSPLGSISRDYLDLIDIPGNAVVIGQMLPAERVEVGHTWQPANKQVARLLRIDAVTKSDLQCKLLEASEGVATIELEGIVNGAVEGVATEFTVNGRFLFSLAEKKIQKVELKLHEEREIGQAQPGFAADTIVTTIRKRCDSPELSTAGVTRLMQQNGEALQLLAFQTRDGKFSFDHDRRWRTIVDRSDLTVLRLVDAGEAIAHCRVSKLSDLPPGKSVSMRDFQTDVRESLGDSFDEFLRANEAKNSAGLDILRLEAVGQTAGEPIRWVCYHIAKESGERVSIVFTMEEKQVERVAAAEGAIAETFRFSKNLSLQARRKSKAR